MEKVEEKDQLEHTEEVKERVRNFNVKKLDYETFELKDLEEHFEEMISARTTGEWEIIFSAEKDYKALVTIFRDKIEWKGNEAISVITAAESLRTVKHKEGKWEIKDDGSLLIVLSAHEIEAIVNLGFKFSDKGVQSAKAFLNGMLPFTSILAKLRAMDEELQKIQAQIEVLKNPPVEPELDPEKDLLLENEKK